MCSSYCLSKPRSTKTCNNEFTASFVSVVDGSLGAIRSSLATSDIHAEKNALGDEHCAQVISHVSELLQKMGRAGLQPDGVTYSVLHGMWLQLGNLPQAVGALAQAKHRAAQSHARRTASGFGGRVATEDSTDDAASSSSIGEPLWDQVLRDEEIGRHLRSMATASCLETRSEKKEDLVRISRFVGAAERLHRNEEEHQGPLPTEQLCAPLHLDYDFARRSLLGSTCDLY